MRIYRAFVVAVAMFGGGCTTRMHYDYFEPSGLDTVVSMPPQAPKNVARFNRDGCELQVRAEVSTENLVVITLRAFVPPGVQVAFSGNRANLQVASAEEEFSLSWQEWTLSDGVGARREVAFDAPLKPQSFTRTPTRKGIENMGRYETTIILPERHSDVREFSITLPGPGAHPLLHLKFVRKTADYRMFVQLQ